MCIGLFLFISKPNQMTYFVYALKSLERNYIYVGLTNNVQRRVYEHNIGYNRTTKPYRPT